MFSLAGKVAVITGGASGIGLAIVRQFRKAGATVVIADRHHAQEIADEEGASLFQADVAEEDEIVAMLEFTRAERGGIDILVNNAGIQPLGVGFGDLTPAIWDRTMDVNARSVALGIKHGGRLLREGGRIVNMASFVGVIGVPRGTAYAASKAAIVHLTKLGAIELAPRRITVNAISPGTVRTPAVTGIENNPEIAFIEAHTPLGRLIEPDEIAAAAQFLASDEAAAITGHNLCVDGGISAGWMRYDLVAPANVRNGMWEDEPVTAS
jgi:NAD(P)-dependent dehydrogenase (short-subunit alcohol dehydrogenase family)